MATKLPQIAKIPNKETPKAGIAYRYARAYQLLLTKETQGMQARILAVKGNPSIKDSAANDFIERVIRLAESDTEL